MPHQISFLTSLKQSRWLNIGLNLCLYIELDYNWTTNWTTTGQANKNDLDQYPAIQMIPCVVTNHAQVLQYISHLFLPCQVWVGGHLSLWGVSGLWD